MRHAGPALCLLLAACSAHGDPQPKALDPAPTLDAIREPARPAVALALPPLEDPPPALRWAPARCDLPPLSLTASDGSGLALTHLSAEAVVHGPLAFTELHLEFHNPEDRVIEGQFAVTLPEDAAISRLAMNIDGRWQEGEVVEKQAARVAYEDFLHRRQDPALMEREAGNVYRARVFPIPARGDKQLIVSYSQELAGAHEPYRLPLCGLPELGKLDVRVSVRRPQPGSASTPAAWSEQVFEVHEQHFVPRGDLDVEHVGASASYGVRSGKLAIASVTPLGGLLEDRSQPIARAVILFDTSASRANDFTGQVARLGELVRALALAHAGLEVEVLAFDQSAERIYAGPAAAFGDRPEAALRERAPLGASNFDVALTALEHDTERLDRLIIVSDGVITAGDEVGALGDRLRALATRGLRRVDVIVDGNSADRPALTTLVRAGLADDGMILAGAAPLAELVTRLGAATRSGIAVEVEGATWVWPPTIDGVQPGDATMIYAELASEDPSGALRVTLDGVATQVPMLAGPAVLVERARARATIAGLEASLLRPLEPAEQAAIRADIVAASVRARVLSDQTALLVLETEADYRRFGIERQALAEILTIGAHGVEVMHRRGDALVVSNSGQSWGGEDERERKQASVRHERIELSDDGPLGGSDGGFGEGFGSGSGSASRSAAGAAHEDIDGLLDPSRPSAEPRPASHVAEAIEPSTIEPAPIEPAPIEPAPIDRQAEIEPPPRSDPYTGTYAEIMRLLARERGDEALTKAQAWATEAPGDVLAMLALGEAHQAGGDLESAARAYGSLIDLHPSRADIRRMAGARLEALDEVGLALAEDSYRRAVEQRPDHPSGYRLLAWVLVKRGAVAEAFSVLASGLDRPYPDDRYLGVEKVLREDLGIIAAVWLAREPSREAEIRELVAAHFTTVNRRPSLRFVLNWETDANDVDLHVWDRNHDHAFYSNLELASGGNLVADVTTGYGPEAFVMYGRKSGYPYRIMANYYARGPMGYGMGKLQVLEHDGEGNVAFSEHPFVVMKDQAYVELTTLRRRLIR